MLPQIRDHIKLLAHTKELRHPSNPEDRALLYAVNHQIDPEEFADKLQIPNSCLFEDSNAWIHQEHKKGLHRKLVDLEQSVDPQLTNSLSTLRTNTLSSSYAWDTDIKSPLRCEGYSCISIPRDALLGKSEAFDVAGHTTTLVHESAATLGAVKLAGMYLHDDNTIIIPTYMHKVNARINSGHDPESMEEHLHNSYTVAALHELGEQAAHYKGYPHSLTDDQRFILLHTSQTEELLADNFMLQQISDMPIAQQKDLHAFLLKEYEYSQSLDGSVLKYALSQEHPARVHTSALDYILENAIVSPKALPDESKSAPTSISTFNGMAFDEYEALPKFSEDKLDAAQNIFDAKHPK